MRKLESVQMIMMNHSSDRFTFLKGPGGKANRALYYNALSKILFVEDCSIKTFLDFMKPFEIQLQSLLALNSVEDFRQDSVKVSFSKGKKEYSCLKNDFSYTVWWWRAIFQSTLQGLFKDLQGFLTPIQTRTNYLMFFEWFYPDYMQVMLKGLQSWGADLLSTSLLKFYSEFVNNRSQRLTFERSSADGILLFRETSKVLITYGNVSGERYACIAVSPSMLNCFL